jgi:isopentenyl-diphosphate Delta-isomerase
MGNRGWEASVERVILVTEQDIQIGTEDKLRAHAEGRLHRAFSVFLRNDRDEILLQRRAADKYHSGGLWSNTCCSHPRPGESVHAAARRRLREEMGVTCVLRHAFAFTYRVQLAGDLWEHEYDHVFLGTWDGTPVPDPAEVAEWRWVSTDDLRREVHETPAAFTYWLRLALDELCSRGLIPEHETT